MSQLYEARKNDFCLSLFHSYTVNAFVLRVNGTFRIIMTTEVRHSLQYKILIYIPHEKSQLVRSVDGEVSKSFEGLCC